MTNNQAIAYAAIAIEQLGYTREQIEKIKASMLSEMDWTDEVGKRCIAYLCLKSQVANTKN